VIRFFILQSHYRSTLDFSEEAVQGTKTGLEKLLNTVRNLRDEIKKAESEQQKQESGFDLAPFKERFMEAMNDDFNTPQAIAVMFDLIKEVNVVLNKEQKISHIKLKEMNEFINELGGKVLGIISEQLQDRSEIIGNEERLIEILIDARHRAKIEKAWRAADLIRKQLELIGIRLEDKKDGTTWRKIH
jgi:cysteinyl-tRNA synthetase